ncbi:cupredoxin family copper-binding protein [Marinovum sp. 2_MG-2023]|uniref:cupredoxin domain-containing protein n=1 Tax=unclassified Marinovum TaxID=2647166 RepID=UPI0026E2256F|nr:MULTISPECIES: cupredoxin family copper-binding protein [unclassified Marinovum]MDO6730364.1 cupredoxin family copper-binding protein [Marinovum sp. 2_MG-2023]MDO6778344.1 cupredoxin family copper-binding protein [Marinovum sp. 1_MG-2023]
MNMITRRTALLGLAAVPVALAGAAQAATHNVSIKGFAFSPSSLTVAAGDTVVFTNEDSAPHTATAENGAFGTGTLRKGETASFEVTTAGAFDYHCKFHPAMKATLVVE